uniref:Uncharacterized protein n=2 Tax=Opuntia streptacantha TaxID=393608 RepID=A0A7C9DTV5_OPUST
MVSPNTLAVLCAILLWLPIALYFTIFHHPPAISATVSGKWTSFSPPPPLEDDPDDVALFNRASRAEPYPTRPGKKIAFLFMTTTPLHLAPLWELFFTQSGAQGKYNIYIHADPRFKYDNPAFTGVFAGRVIPSSKPTSRNSPTLIAAARRLLAHALLDDSANDVFTLLSSTCIPLHSFSFTYRMLESSTRSFIEALKNETTAKERWVVYGNTTMLPEVRLDQLRIGSQFWSLTRRHALVVVEDVRLWKKFRLPCMAQNACFPEESYFPTLLTMVDPAGVVPATLTHVNWQAVLEDQDGHPYTYSGHEVGPKLIQWLREASPRYGDLGINGSDLLVKGRRDPFLFARKFAPGCSEPLVSLANNVLFMD